MPRRWGAEVLSSRCDILMLCSKALHESGVEESGPVRGTCWGWNANNHVVASLQAHLNAAQPRGLSTGTVEAAKEVWSASAPSMTFLLYSLILSFLRKVTPPISVLHNMLAQAVHNASFNSWAAPAAGALLVGAGATYYFSRRTPMAGSRSTSSAA